MRVLRFTAFFLLISFFLPGLLRSQVPEGGVMLNAESGVTWRKVGRGTVTEIEVSDQPFTEGLRAVTGTDVTNYWDAQIQFPSARGIAAGDVVLVAFYARTVSAEDETGQGALTVVIENSTTYAKELSVKFSLGSDWKEYYASAVCVSTLSSTGVRYAFQTGYPSQTIEVADVRFLNYGDSLSIDDMPVTEITYVGQEPDAEWRAPAEERINRIRKGNVDLVIFDEHGNRVEGADVTIEMVRHRFGFGTAIPAGLFNRDEVFRNKVFELFNEVVFENDLKWQQFNPDFTSTIRRALDTLERRQIPVRGHNIVWPSWRWLPSSLHTLEDDPDALRRAVEKRIDEVTLFTKGRLNDWDVVNEPYSQNDLLTILGEEVIAEWFKRVRQNDPAVKLYLNDYGIISGGGLNRVKQDYYYDLVRSIDNLGGEVDGIGIQGHFSTDLTPITRVYSILDRFAELGKEIKITEHDVNITQREVQAEYTRDLMTIVFSHPSVKSFMFWGFWEDSHWRPDGAMFNSDWSIRPHGEVYKEMVFNRWWTDEATKTTGRDGEASFDGFLGTYRYIVKAGEAEVTGTFELENPYDSDLPNLVTITLDTPDQGFFMDDWAPKSIAIDDFEPVPQTTEEATVNVTVNRDSVITNVSRYVYGHNAAAWGGKLDESPRAVRHIKSLSPNVMRWPGGSMSNDYLWDATGWADVPADLPPDFPYRALLYGSNNNSWTMSVDNFYNLLEMTGSEASISVNYSYARYGTGEDPVLTAARYAADWVRYDNGRTRYWEIGNENYGSWERGYTIDQSLNRDGQPRVISGELYGEHSRVFIREMRKAAEEIGHEIRIGLVTRNEHVSYTDNVMNNWNRGMMSQAAREADFLVPHTYFTPYNQDSGVSTILNSATKISAIKKYIDEGLKTHAGLDPMPIALTEWNIFAKGSMQQVSYINGMHAVLVLGEAIKNRFGMAIRWDLMNGWSDGDNHGIFADGEPGIPRYTPRAPFFYMYYFQKFFGDHMVGSSVTGSSDVVAYASGFYSGHSGIVLVNKGKDDQVVGIDIEGSAAGERYYYYLLTGGDDNGDFSRKVYVNGITTDYEGGGPDDYEDIIPYGTETGNGIKLELPGLATLFVVVEGDADLEEQTILFDSIPPLQFADTVFRVYATAGSGLPVRFASTDPGVAKVKNDLVTITGAGTCGIIALQQGDSIYAPATPVIRELKVLRADQSLEMEPFGDVTYGDEDFYISAVSSSGLPLYFSSSDNGVAGETEGRISINGAGTAEITAGQDGNARYNRAEPVTQTLTVNKSGQDISFPVLPEKSVDDPDFPAGATASSGLEVTYTSSDTEVAVVSDGMIQITGAGTATITAMQDGDENFNAAPEVSRELVVLAPTAIDEAEPAGDDGIMIFPNPASGYVTIITGTGDAMIRIYNQTGVLVYHDPDPPAELVIPVDELGGNGVYLVRVNSTVKRLVVLN